MSRQARSGRMAPASEDSGAAYQRPTLAEQRASHQREQRERRMRDSIITDNGVQRLRDLDADRRPRRGFGATMSRPIVCYFGFIVCVGLLVLFGLVMVFSSSSVDLIAAGLSPYSQAAQQLLFAIAGLVAAMIGASIPAQKCRKYAIVFFALILFVQLLTATPLGASAGGNTGWVRIGRITFQPAEFLKLLLCLTMPAAMVTSRKLDEPWPRWDRSATAKMKWRRYVVPYLVPIAELVASFGAVMVGHDLGTGLIVALIGVVALMAGGLNWRGIVTLVFLGLVLILTRDVSHSGNRMSRIQATLNGCHGAEDKQSVCWQVIHGHYALASGGLFGVGLGASREKWSYLPEAHNDFIFAVIGEELGFVGALIVILLFALLAWFLGACAWQMRPTGEASDNPAARSTDLTRQYARIVLICILSWLFAEAALNILVVLQLVPVIGIPLPFISSGGSALIACMCASGFALSMMREQPEIAALLPRRRHRRRRKQRTALNGGSTRAARAGRPVRATRSTSARPWASSARTASDRASGGRVARSTPHSSRSARPSQSSSRFSSDPASSSRSR